MNYYKYDMHYSTSISNQKNEHATGMFMKEKVIAQKQKVQCESRVNSADH